MHKRIQLFLAAVVGGACLLSCQQVQESTVPAPSPIPAAPVVASQPRPQPPAPIVLQKPRVIGPVAPSIVLLPDHIAEPLIRVKLTDELDYRPTIQRRYHGRIQIVALPNNKFVAVNVVPIDDYLAGVLPKEILGSWDPETFRTQAIVARTFALFQMVTEGKGRPWDVSNDVSSQMYGGIAGETAKSRAAVRETAGQVLMATLNGKTGIFCARYSSCAGGATQDPFDAWGDPSLPALAPRKIGAIENISPNAHFTWPTMSVEKSDLSRCIRNWGERNSFAYLTALGPIKAAAITKRNPATGRPVEITLTDTANHAAPIRAEEFRLALLNDPAGAAPKPYSSYFDIRDAGSTLLLVNGRGYGHGIGMSQWGAQALALQGKSHEQILSFFYPGSTIRELW